MKGLNEYKAEIFRRSESRIKERRRNRNRVLALCIPLCLILVLIPAAVLPDFTADSSPDVSDSAPLIDSGSMDDGAYNGDTAALGSFESFSFSLVWNCYGVSSYDSETGRLIKTTDATNPEDYITHCELTEDAPDIRAYKVSGRRLVSRQLQSARRRLCLQPYHDADTVRKDRHTSKDDIGRRHSDVIRFAERTRKEIP